MAANTIQDFPRIKFSLCRTIPLYKWVAMQENVVFFNLYLAITAIIYLT